ncbi:MAG TPA: hypothetical protein VIA62_13305 [Thermoanaerobaculia bacterium]|nr:hypothetical protein [Thermoanaerobaculia bacterium]
MTRLTVPAVLVCFALVSSSGAWARPVHDSAPVPQGQVSLAENLLAWTLSLLFEKPGVPRTRPAAKPPHVHTKEGPQADPNGSPH